jgi:hypothetical protein
MASRLGARLAGLMSRLTGGRLEPNPSQGLRPPATILPQMIWPH